MLRSPNLHISPDLAVRHAQLACQQLGAQAWCHHNESFRSMPASERDQMLRVFSRNLERDVFAELKQVWLMLSQVQNFPDQISFDSPIVHIGGEFPGKRCLSIAPVIANLPELRQHMPSNVVIHSPPIVRID